MLRKWLLALLGEKRYLYFLATSFQRMYRVHLLGVSYQDIYFLKEIIQSGDVCIDIGAHLGYFTLEMSRLAGPSGHVYAIEPMGKFNRTIGTLLRQQHINNVTLHQYAMGGDSPWVDMGIPEINKKKKFAYARIVHSSTHLTYIESEKVENVKGDQLFSDLRRINFIKCDVEGLEVSVFNSFLSQIQKHRPVILCELGDMAERNRLHDLLKGFGYGVYYLQNKKLLPLDRESEVIPVSHNHYFIPGGKVSRLLFSDPPQV